MIVLLIILLSFIYIFNHYNKHHFKTKKAFTLTLTLFVSCIISILVLLHPNDALIAGQEGVAIWIKIIIPSILPFLICSNILVDLGVAEFIGSLLEPIIKPIFNVPGEGAYTFSISIASGYPIGARTLRDMLAKNNSSITPNQAQRILAFSSTSGPLFLIGSVAIGMLNSPTVGSLLAISHYLGALLTGICFRFYYDYKMKSSEIKRSLFSFNKSLDTIANIHKKSSTSHKSISFGNIISESVTSSMHTILMIGGFVILYSIILRILANTEFFNTVVNILHTMLPFVSKDLISGFICGLIEMTNGCKIISSLKSISWITKLCVISFLISWSGLSIHSQVISIIKNTQIKIKPYIFSKLIHGLLSAILTFGLYNIFYAKNDHIPSFNARICSSILPSSFLSVLAFSFKLFAVIIITLLIFGLVYNFIAKIHK